MPQNATAADQNVEWAACGFAVVATGSLAITLLCAQDIDRLRWRGIESSAGSTRILTVESSAISLVAAMNKPQLIDQPDRRFIADAMLGRLARWLRILGYDTAYEKVITDEALVERAVGEDRWVLTRDRRLVLRKLLRGRHTLLAADDVDGQLRQLYRDLAIDLDLTHQRAYRCADCNVVLTSISYADAAPVVPLFVAQEHREFLRCPDCRRLFWPGTHWQDFNRRLIAIRARSLDNQP